LQPLETIRPCKTLTKRRGHRTGIFSYLREAEKMYKGRENVNHDKIKIIGLIDQDAVIISHHARVRMFERNISTDDLLLVIRNGEVFESYPDDEPCPSLLMLGFIRDQAYHVVLGVCTDHLRVITAYTPDDEHWTDTRTRRKKE
jgi:hypothetical protein